MLLLLLQLPPQLAGVCRKLSNQLQAERAERTARNTQLRDMSIRQSTLLDIGKALERRTNTSLSRLQQEVRLWALLPVQAPMQLHPCGGSPAESASTSCGCPV